jgi:cation diffusion facilitator family transporter
MRTTVLALLASVVLASVKIAAGLLGSSYALVADGIESILDIFGALVVLGALRLSTVEPSSRFPYGVGKAEPLGALAVASLLLIAAAGIAAKAVGEIFTPHAAPAPFTLAVLIGVIVTKEVLFRTVFAGAEVVGSLAMESDAWHHRSDALTSAAAFIGISVALFMGDGYESADDWAALGACVVIAYNGVRLFRGALMEILDVAAPDDVLQRVRALAAAVEGVSGIDVCHVRRSGLVFLVDIHVEVDGDMSVQASHEVAHRVKDALLQSELPVLDALVHIEPADASP